MHRAAPLLGPGEVTDVGARRHGVAQRPARCGRVGELLADRERGALLEPRAGPRRHAPEAISALPRIAERDHLDVDVTDARARSRAPRPASRSAVAGVGLRQQREVGLEQQRSSPCSAHGSCRVRSARARRSQAAATASSPRKSRWSPAEPDGHVRGPAYVALGLVARGRQRSLASSVSVLVAEPPRRPAQALPRGCRVGGQRGLRNSSPACSQSAPASAAWAATSGFSTSAWVLAMRRGYSPPARLCPAAGADRLAGGWPPTVRYLDVKILSRPSAPSERPRSLVSDSKIIYTHTDEAPLLATYSFLPIIEAYASKAGVGSRPATSRSPAGSWPTSPSARPRTSGSPTPWPSSASWPRRPRPTSSSCRTSAPRSRSSRPRSRSCRRRATPAGLPRRRRRPTRRRTSAPATTRSRAAPSTRCCARATPTAARRLR